jgi:hypothetical protein
MAFGRTSRTISLVRSIDGCIVSPLLSARAERHQFSKTLRFSHGPRKMRFPARLICCSYFMIFIICGGGLALFLRSGVEAKTRDLFYRRSREHAAFMASTEPNPNLKTMVRFMRVYVLSVLVSNLSR